MGEVIGGVHASSSYVEFFLGSAVACLLFGVVMAMLLQGASQPGSDHDGADTQGPGGGGPDRCSPTAAWCDSR